jgi:ankyrin repeat protein
MPARNKIAALLIRHGADVNRADAGGSTALHFAVLNRNPELIRMLLAGGAKKNVKDSQGYTPLDLAKSWDDEAAATLEAK